MRTRPKRYTVTSALPYANGPLHIGHLAGAYLSADIYARYLRLQGEDVVFICGSDEHGAAITIRAKKEGTTPKEIVDRYHENIKATFKKLNVSFDIYHRTSESIHHQTAQDFFRQLHAKGEFTEKTSEQYFDEEHQQFLADRYIKGTCPKCGHEDAYGDQCEKCGSSLSPTDLINPKSTLSGNKPILKSTTHWYLSLDKHTKWLSEWIDTGKIDGQEHHDPKEWKNHVLGQCRSWITDLQPRAMTRDLDWGVDVPQELNGAVGKKLYVWLDAPIGYISATKQWAEDNNKSWEPYWKDNDTKLVHFIGKDNIVFHCIIFPAILKAAGDYILPDNVPANQFLNLQGDKLSTSRNWAVWAHEYLEETKESITNNVDVLRYVLIRNMPEQKDSEFTWENFKELNDAELTGKFANFINRVVVLTNKYYKGAVPDFDTSLSIFGGTEEGMESNYQTEVAEIEKLVAHCGTHIAQYDFRSSLKSVIDLATLGNQFLQFNAPWKAVKTEPEKVKVVLNLSLQIVEALSVIVQPFLPDTSDRIRNILNVEPLVDGEWKSLQSALEAGNTRLAAGHQINKPLHLFAKVPDEVITQQIEKLGQTDSYETSYPVLKEEASFDDFMKMDIRTGTIVEAEKVPKAKKLLKLKVDIGMEQRTVVSGIAEFFQPEDIVGQEVLILINLAPRKLRGVLSEGMVLMAENDKGELAFVCPRERFGNGFTVR